MKTRKTEEIDLWLLEEFEKEEDLVSYLQCKYGELSAQILDAIKDRARQLED